MTESPHRPQAPDGSLEHPAVRTHLEDTLRSWLGVRPGADVDVPPFPDSLARLLLRTEEYEQPHRDWLGRWEFAYSENYRRGRLWVPEVDEWVTARRRELSGRTPLDPLWPDGRQFAVCLTHDVDMISFSSTPGQIGRTVRTALKPHPTEANGPARRAFRAARGFGRAAYLGVSSVPPTEETLERTIGLEQELGVTSSYFFTVDSPRSTPVDCIYRPNDRCRFRGKASRLRDVIRVLDAEGFDVGLHGSYESAFDADLLRTEKEMLEEIVGTSVRTTRQHYLHWDVRVTPLVQERAGLGADSTLGFNRNVGFRAGTCLPFRPFDLERGRPIDVLEAPLIIEEFPLLRNNSLELSRALAEQVVCQLVDTVSSVQGVATLLFHPHSLRSPDYLALYRYAIEYALEQGAWVTSLREIERWWRERERRLALGRPMDEDSVRG